MTLNSAAHSLPPRTPEVVTTDTPCRKCQYNLRTLSIDSRCPECGTPVVFSVRGGLIRYSDPDWLDQIRLGMGCVAGALTALDLILAVFVPLIVNRKDPPASLGGVVALAAACLAVAGLWHLMAPDPTAIRNVRLARLRRFIRVAAYWIAIGVAINYLDLSGRFPDRQNFFVLVLGIVALAVSWALGRYVSEFALRIPDDRLAKRAKIAMWGLGLTIGILCACYGAMMYRQATAGYFTIVDRALGCCSLLDALLLLIFLAQLLAVLRPLRTRLREQSTLARQTSTAQFKPGTGQ